MERHGEHYGENLEGNLQDLSETAEARSVPGEAGSEGVHTRRRMDGSGRSEFRRWKTRSSSEPRSRY